jgi:uncharacterized membrane protein YkvA (DUF1232 family)
MRTAAVISTGRIDGLNEAAGMGIALDGEILDPEAEAERVKRAAGSNRGILRSLKRLARHVPGSEELVAAYYCAVDPQTPQQVRWVLLGALAAFLLPFGPVPRLIARFGFADRISSVAIATATVAAHIKDAHRAAARDALAE